MGILAIGAKPVWENLRDFTGNNIYTVKVFDAVAIVKAESALSDAIELNLYRPTGFFSIQITIAGTSSEVKVEYLLSHDGTTYSDCGADITTAFGPGTNIYDFPSGEPFIAPWMKLKVTETGTTNNVTSCTLYLCIQ